MVRLVNCPAGLGRIAKARVLERRRCDYRRRIWVNDTAWAARVAEGFAALYPSYALTGLESERHTIPCSLRSACSSPDTQPKTFGSPSSVWTK